MVGGENPDTLAWVGQLYYPGHGKRHLTLGLERWNLESSSLGEEAGKGVALPNLW